MRGFLAISCLLSIAVAAPQYNYNSPSYGSASNFQNQYSTGSSFGSGLVGGGFISGGSGGGLGGGSFGGGSDGGSFGNALAFNTFNAAPALPSASSVAASYRAHPPSQKRILPPIVSKHVYFHTAQDEPDEEIYEDNSTEQQRKHYNVVFIKAPHQSVRKIAAQTAQALNEEKTAIYVLSKKNDISEIRQAISDTPIQPTKPDVFFVKYKTPEEAQHAQQTIQAQYDALGGSTNISNEGFAPISSVVGILGGHGGGHSGHGAIVGHGGHGSFTSGGGSSIISSGGDNFINAGSNIAGSVISSYLPPNKV